jgi:flavin reductase (DIM6/NTAB) family NADH-FMN oxidoreductase RutF
VSVAVNKQRAVLDWLGEGAAFVLNVVPEGGRVLVAHFGKGFALGEPAFANLDVTRAGDSPPVLRAALAHLVCRVAARVDVGDHVLLIARVTGAGVSNDGKPAVHVRKSGLRY